MTKQDTTITTVLMAALSGVIISIVMMPGAAPAVHDVDTTQYLLELTPAPTPMETPYPKPNYEPELRPYKINKNHDIWHADNPSSYITPNNEWVQYYASQLYVAQDGRIEYKNEFVPYVTDVDGTILLYTNKPFINNYVYDWEQFGNGAKGSLANDDYWVNPDYYLTNGMKGDCDAWAVTVASMMLSGEMSIKEGDSFTKQVIPAKVMMGYIGNMRDVWVEYEAYNKTWITSVGRRDGRSSNLFIEKDNQFKPLFEFTDKYFRGIT